MAKFFKTDQRYVLREDYDTLQAEHDTLQAEHDALTANLDGAWTSVPATITAGVGTFTSVAGTIRYKKIGTTVHAIIRITITTVGTASSVVNVTNMPFAAPLQAIGCGRERQLTGSALQAFIDTGSQTLQILTYSNTSPIGAGHVLVCSITYETAP